MYLWRFVHALVCRLVLINPMKFSIWGATDSGRMGGLSSRNLLGQEAGCVIGVPVWYKTRAMGKIKAALNPHR